MGKDAETREELIAAIKDLRTRLAETEEALLATRTRKSRNNQVRKHDEDEKPGPKKGTMSGRESMNYCNFKKQSIAILRKNWRRYVISFVMFLLKFS